MKNKKIKRNTSKKQKKRQTSTKQKLVSHIPKIINIEKNSLNTFQRPENDLKNIEVIHKIHPEFARMWWFIAVLIVFFGILAVILFIFVIHGFFRVF